MHHLESCLEASPAAYIQRRFADGIDKELANLSMMKLTPEEEVLRNKKGNVYSIVDRVLKGKMMQCATPTPRRSLNPRPSPKPTPPLGEPLRKF
jgi:hypothetical protein